MKIETYENWMWFLMGAMAILVIVFIVGVSEKRDKEVMKITYCFEERADGSLYHYVCEK